MAFTKNPAELSISTKRLNFVGNPEQRSHLANKDQRFINYMAEKTGGPDNQNQQWWLRSRPGIQGSFVIPTGTPRGVFYWDGSIISVIDNKVYANATLLGTILTGSGRVGFTEFLTDTGAVYLVLVDGTYGYTFASTASAPVQITSVDFPTPHVPTPIFLDGYLFLAKPGTQDIYNSNLNDPGLWTAGDYISAEMYPDTIVGLTRNNNYIYAVGQTSIEFLYDAATATGSPLGRHDSAVQQFGTPSIATAMATDKEVVMVGQIGMGGLSVWTIDGFKENDIGIPAVKLALNAEGVAIANAYAYCVKVAGQKFYVLNLSNRILVYGMETKLWTEWQFAYPVVGATDGNAGYPYVIAQTGVTCTIGVMTDLVQTDLGQPITCTVVTSKYDFDTSDRKRMDSLVLLSDVPADGTIMNVQYSDDDYNTWSTVRAMDINSTITILFRLGMFRRRAFKFTYSQPYTIRLEGIEVVINKGTT